MDLLNQLYLPSAKVMKHKSLNGGLLLQSSIFCGENCQPLHHYCYLSFMIHVFSVKIKLIESRLSHQR